MPIPVFVTTDGRAALINAESTGTLPVTIAEAGVSATAVTPSEAATSLPGEIKRLSTIAGEVVAADTIHVSVIDQSNDAYTLRSLALYLDDGTLFAIAGQADPILEKAAPSIAAIAFDIVLADIAATSIAFGDASFSNPAATTERQGVVELATDAEVAAGTDPVRVVTPAGAAAAFVKKAGDTMTGQLALPGDPTAAGHAARKAYVDALTTAAAILAKLITVDGSGSGIDADMLDGLDASAFLRAQPGEVKFFAMAAAPTGFLECNGSAVSRTTYAALFAAIGTTYGAGNGTTTFNLPDARGEFIRGWDHGRGVDPARALGSGQLDALQNITGAFSFISGGVASATGPFANDGPATNHITSPVSGTDSSITFDASRVARTADETRPRNLALLVCIKI